MLEGAAPAISLYGAGLATILALWQFWHAFQERRWISTSYNFCGIEDPGSEVLLINNSPKPLTLYQIELFWGRRYLFWMRRYRRVGESEWGEEDSDTGFTLEPFKISALHYMNNRHFNWCYEIRPTARLYLRTRIVGRKLPMELFVYRQDNWTPTLRERILATLGFRKGIREVYIDEIDQDSLI